jgi:hypothetical protein
MKIFVIFLNVMNMTVLSQQSWLAIFCRPPINSKGKLKEEHMRVAYFTDTYSPEVNGVTNTLSRLGNYLDKLNIHQLVIAPDYKREDLECD